LRAHVYWVFDEVKMALQLNGNLARPFLQEGMLDLSGNLVTDGVIALL